MAFLERLEAGGRDTEANAERTELVLAPVFSDVTRGPTIIPSDDSGQTLPEQSISLSISNYERGPDTTPNLIERAPPRQRSSVTWNPNQLGRGHPTIPEAPALPPMSSDTLPVNGASIMDEADLRAFRMLTAPEPTRRAQVPKDLLEETRPEAQLVEPSLPESARNAPQSARPRSLAMPSGSAQAEDTDYDLAALLGIPPDELESRASVQNVHVEEPLPLLPMEALLEAPLEVPTKARQTPKKKKPPSERFGASQLRRLVEVTETTSKIIPIIIASFVLLATILISVALLSRHRDARQQHVEIRFLSMKGPNHPAAVEGTERSTLRLETVPPGVLVLLDRRLLGKTPLEVELPFLLDDPVGIELSGPYYELWVTETHRGEDGLYQVLATLRKK